MKRRRLVCARSPPHCAALAIRGLDLLDRDAVGFDDLGYLSHLAPAHGVEPAGMITPGGEDHAVGVERCTLDVIP